MLHLLPVMFAIYFMSYIHRTNVALAKTHLATDVGIGAAAFGFGAGVFFISYAFLEIPSNLLMYRVGPRRWIARIAVTWGALSALMMFVAGSDLLLRLALPARRGRGRAVPRPDVHGHALASRSGTAPPPSAYLPRADHRPHRGQPAGRRADGARRPVRPARLAVDVPHRGAGDRPGRRARVVQAAVGPERGPLADAGGGAVLSERAGGTTRTPRRASAATSRRPSVDRSSSWSR